MEITVNSFTVLIIILLTLLMFIGTYLEKKFKNNKENYILGANFIIMVLAIASLALKDEKNLGIKSNFLQLFLLGLFSIASISYTIYEWDTNKNSSTCNAIIPKSTYFNSADYYVYRLLYLATLIVLVTLLQFKIDDSNFSPLGIDKKNLHKLLFLIPFIIPMLTELVTVITNKLPGPDVNPESLLLNFIKGNNKEWKNQWARSIMPFLFYTLLMGGAMGSINGYVGNDGGKTIIYIILLFLIFFSFIMRTLFIQDCSLDKDIDKSKKKEFKQQLACAIEKYGGLQTMFNITLIIIIVYHINKPSFKLLFFIIICLASWGLSNTYILNIKE